MDRAPNLEEMLEQNDAALIIGDPGMAFPRHGLNVWDMAVSGSSTPVSDLFLRCGWSGGCGRARSRSRFCRRARRGRCALEEIVRSYQDKIPMRVDELRNYLTENIVFNVDESMEKGCDSILNWLSSTDLSNA